MNPADFRHYLGYDGDAEDQYQYANGVQLPTRNAHYLNDEDASTCDHNVSAFEHGPSSGLPNLRRTGVFQWLSRRRVRPIALEQAPAPGRY